MTRFTVASSYGRGIRESTNDACWTCVKKCKTLPASTALRAGLFAFHFAEPQAPTYDKNEFPSRADIAQDSATAGIGSPIPPLYPRDRTPARRVALVGFGTVGRAVAKILCERSDGLLRLTHICNRNVERKKQPWCTERSFPSDVSLD